LDTRGSAGIADASGAVEELPAAATRCAALLEARKKTQVKLQQLREKIDGAQLPARTSLVLFGSWGRHELTDESDDDWALLVDDSDLNLEGPAVQAALAHLRDIFNAGQPPGRQAYFGCAFHSEPLRERIGPALSAKLV